MNGATPILATIARGRSGTTEWGTCELCDTRITRSIGATLSWWPWWHLETRRISCKATGDASGAPSAEKSK